MVKQQEKTGYSNNIVAWFVTLEIARRKNDFEQAAKAKRELARLGVNVNYDVPKEICHAG